MTAIPCGLCQCGCGGAAPISNRNVRKQGYVKGQVQRFIRGHYRPPHRGGDGYRQRSWRGRNVKAHIAVAEAALGHRLPPKSVVHHVDNDKQNNANRNLVICQDQEYHKLLHFRARIIRAGGDPNLDRVCSVCGQVKPVDQFGRDKNNTRGTRSNCRVCRLASERARAVDARQPVKFERVV